MTSRAAVLVDAGGLAQLLGLEPVLGSSGIAAAEGEGLALVLLGVVGPLEQQGSADPALAGGLGANRRINCKKILTVVSPVGPQL